MAGQDKSKKRSKEILCQRCKGRMAFEKFYSDNDSFFGWRCVSCGDILDAVILLHRLSQDSGIEIPEEQEETMALLRHYLTARRKKISTRVGRIRGNKHADAAGNIDSTEANRDNRAFPAQAGMPGF